jgi:hypothetical protein
MEQRGHHDGDDLEVHGPMGNLVVVGVKVLGLGFQQVFCISA